MLWNHYSVIPLAVLEIEENEPAKMLHLCFRSTGVEEDREPSAAPFGHSQPVPLLLCYPACSKRQGDYLLLWSCQKAFIADNSTSFHLEQARKEVVWGLQQNGVPLWDSTLYDLPRRSRLAPVHLLKPRHVAELMDFSFGSNPLKWSPFEEPDFVLSPQWEAEAVQVFTRHEDSSKQIHSHLLILVVLWLHSHLPPHRISSVWNDDASFSYPEIQQNHLPDWANVLASCSAGSLLEERCKQEGSWFGSSLISLGLFYVLRRASTQKSDAFVKR